MVGDDEQAAEQRLDEDRDLGGAQQVPEGNRGRSRNQAMPPMATAARLSRITAQPTTMMDARPSGLYPPKRVGIRLADAENHYVASCHKLGV